ncbi:MAG: AraC family transcriptional regulator [Desulfobacterales bacterium]|nr:AraC family transcriptional regulator [Desulfobacterales bacterium]MCP4161604.1 AraC family transcriptional regulator [Deltaproteobacteria bacterium]
MTDYQATVSMELTNILLDYTGRIGIDSDKLCESVGITAARLKEMDYRIGFEKFGALWEAAVNESGDPHFGLNSIKDAIENYPGGHILFQMVLNCSTIESALQKFFKYHDLMNDVVKPRLELENEVFYITWDLFDNTLKLPRQISEALLYLYSFILSTLSQKKIKLTEVHFTHSQPQNTIEHKKIFQAPLKWDQAVNKIVAKRKSLKYSLFWANPELLKTLEQVAKTNIEKIHSGKTWSNKTSHLINRKIVNGEKITIKSIAKTFGLSVRNFQNILKDENCTFQKVLNEVRKTVACTYLKRDDVSIVDIAFLLGYSEQSAFNHAFKRWTGSTPREYLYKNL